MALEPLEEGKDVFGNSLGLERMFFGIPWGLRGWILEFLEAGMGGFLGFIGV